MGKKWLGLKVTDLTDSSGGSFMLLPHIRKRGQALKFIEAMIAGD